MSDRSALNCDDDPKLSCRLFIILRSSFDILHFGFCEMTKTEMSNEEWRMMNEEE